MSFNDKTGHCFCERCGYDWAPKDISTAPRSCAQCKSKVWNSPRVYAGKYINGTLAKRFKPTGRAAARANRCEDIELPTVPFGVICAKCGLVEGFNINCCKGKVIVV